MKNDKQRTVSLVLGSGGARGMAHIGVIRCLEDHNYKITNIAGASVGALVGGFYAAGRLDRFESWVTALDKKDVLGLLDLSFSGGGLFKGDKLMEALSSLVRDQVIENLPIDFTAVAVDLERQKEVWFTDGSLFEAIRGSISIPSVFKPHHYRGMWLVDGGVLNPVPVAAVMRHVTDLTIAVNLNAKRNPLVAEPEPSTEHVSLNRSGQAGVQRAISKFIDRWRSEDQPSKAPTSQYSSLELVNRSIETMQNTMAHMKLAANMPDILIEVPYTTGGLFDYHLSCDIIENGYQLCLSALKRLDATAEPNYNLEAVSNANYPDEEHYDELPPIAHQNPS